MSNTLKFGTDGNWATKEGSTLAYNDNNGNFKPLPFNFERAGSATRVNKQGLIEVVSNNEPRIDFKDSSKGSLLLEPSRSNIFTYSEDFSQSSWVKQNINLTSNYELSPSGLLNATRVVTTNTGVDLYQNISVSENTTYTLTFYAKLSDGENIEARFYDLSNSVDISYVNYSSQLSDNQWKRVEVEVTTPLGCTSLRVYLVALSSTLIDVSYWGAQLEAGSYATSYIPTNGATATRNAETSSKANISNLIGQTEGTVYFESTINGLQGGDMRFQLSDGSTNNWIFLSSGEATGIGVKARAYINNGNVNQFNSYSAYLSEGNHKYALAYNLNDIAFYVDGVQVALDTSATIPSCNVISLGGSTPTSTNSLGFLKYDDLKLYNTRLSNAELQALTQV